MCAVAGCFRSSSGLLAVLASTCMPQPMGSNTISVPRGCIVSGSGGVAINAALVGPGAEAVLSPGAVFTLADRLRSTAPNQRTYTARATHRQHPGAAAGRRENVDGANVCAPTAVALGPSDRTAWRALDGAW